jgi:hypothetical protein
VSTYTGAGELTKPRALPDEAYCAPDGRNVRLAVLGTLLDEILFYAVHPELSHEEARRLCAGFARIGKKVANIKEEFTL